MSLTAPPVDPRAPLLPAVVILGNDAQLAARPATPVQLAHAALALGFRAAVPASWGDELVASASLRIIATRGMRPAIHCACPHVARRLLGVGTELAPHLVSLVAPPVAAAKYLRLHAPDGLRVTYVGRCPAAADDSIDARLTPEEFLAQLAERGIDLDQQPEVFESVIPPDRRRYESLPGGLPAAELLWQRAAMRIETLGGDDVALEIAEQVLAHGDVVVDAAPALGCSCAGAGRDIAPADARAAITALEPPRAALSIVDEGRGLSLELPTAVAARAAAELLGDASRPGASTRRSTPLDVALPPAAPATEPPLGRTAPPPAHEPPRRPRLTPPGTPAIVLAPLQAEPPATPPRRRVSPAPPRVVPGAVPVATDQEGRVLPRAYVARRRSPRGGVPVVTDEPSAGAASAPSVPPPETRDSERPIEHSVEPEAVEVAEPSRNLAPPAHGPVERSLTFLTANPRVTLVAVLVTVVMLLGVAIGYAAARRGDPARSDAMGGATGQLRVDSSAASAAPSLTTGARAPASSPAARGAGPAQRTPARRGGGGAGGRGVAPPTPRPDRTASAPAAVQTPAVVPAAEAPAVAPAPVDSTAIRARRDSAFAAARAAARAESLTAQRDSIRHEIERRRARIDSILRAQGGTPPSP